LKRKGLLVLLAVGMVVSLVVFAACGEKPEPAPGDTWQYPDRLLVTAMGSTSPTYGAFVAWTTPWAQDTGVTVRLITESDSRLQQIWVRDGTFFSVAPHQNRSMMYGIKGYARRDWGAWQSRIWMPAGVSFWGACVLKNSGMKTLDDLKPGMKAITISLSEEPQQSLYAFLAWANVDPSTITFIPLSNTGQTGAFLQSGKGDFCLGYVTTASWYEVEASPSGLTWLSFDPAQNPAAAARFLGMYPWTDFGKATAGVPSSEGVPMAMSLPPYITSANMDTELVYRIVKWVDENYDRFKDSHPWCVAMTLENLIKTAEHNYEPIHDGAVKYLEEKGLWTPELEAKRQYNIEQLTLWVDGYQDAITLADERGLTINENNADWQKFWDDYKRDNNLPLLSYDQSADNQPGYFDYYTNWENIRPKF